jgi:predicted DCC family thiol-disulfide oxidoreductase YuxK
MSPRPQKAAQPELLFYDGQCGLCHFAVRFVLARDQTGEAFRFAPLESNAFRTAVPESRRKTLPDSLIVLTADGALLTRSTAVLHILRRLGGRWRLLALIAGVVPRVVRDWLYDGIARIRSHLFRRPPEVCPLVPQELRERFLT